MIVEHEPSIITIWDVAACRKISAIAGLRNPALTAVLSRDGGLAAIQFERGVQVFDVAAEQPITPFLAYRGDARDLVFAPDASALHGSDATGGVVTWPLPRDARDLASWRRLVDGCNPYALQDGTLVRREVDPAACDRARR